MTTYKSPHSELSLLKYSVLAKGGEDGFVYSRVKWIPLEDSFSKLNVKARHLNFRIFTQRDEQGDSSHKHAVRDTHPLISLKTTPPIWPRCKSFNNRDIESFHRVYLRRKTFFAIYAGREFINFLSNFVCLVRAPDWRCMAQWGGVSK